MPDIDLEPGDYRPAKGTKKRSDKPHEPILHPRWPLGVAAFAFPFVISWGVGWLMTNWGWWWALIVIALSLFVARLLPSWPQDQ